MVQGTHFFAGQKPECSANTENSSAHTSTFVNSPTTQSAKQENASFSESDQYADSANSYHPDEEESSSSENYENIQIEVEGEDALAENMTQMKF